MRRIAPNPGMRRTTCFTWSVTVAEACAGKEREHNKRAIATMDFIGSS